MAPAYAGNRVAHTDGSLVIQQYPDLWHQPGNTNESRYDAEPAGITIGKEGAPWFAEADSGLAGYRLAKAVGGEYQEYLLKPCEPTLPCSGSYTDTGPLSVATAPDGSIWFTNVLKNTFGKLDPGTGAITQYSLPGDRLAPGRRRTAGDPRGAGRDALARRAAASSPIRSPTRWCASSRPIRRPRPSTSSAPATRRSRSRRTPPATSGSASPTPPRARSGASPASSGRLGRRRSGGGSTPGGGSSGSTSGGTSSTSTTPPAGKIVVHPGTVAVAKVGETQVKGDSLSVRQICVGPPTNPCAMVYLLDAGEYVTGFPGTRPRAFVARASGRKVRTVVVGSKSVSVPGGSSAKVVIKLNAKGRKILKRDGVLHVTLHVSQKMKKGKAKVLTTKKVTFTAPKK